jgi:hypothetical protein
MQQQLSHCRDGYALRAGDVSPRRLGCNTGIAPFSSSKHLCLFRDAQAGKPARQFRLEAEVTSWLKEAGISSSMK